MKIALAIAFMVLALCAGILTADYKSSFLVDGRALSTLSYFSSDRDDDWRRTVRRVILANGDTHIDILARNTDKNWGIVNDVSDNWSGYIDGLRDDGLAPVIWLRGDDSPEIDALGLSNQLDYNDAVVASVDGKVSHYVVCLECDEYYTAPEVNVLIQRLRQKTDRPIGVHLTPGLEGKEAYVKNADVIYLQTGFNLTDAQFKKEIEYALSLGKPVVVSEYHMDSNSDEARRLGDIACGYTGVVGTGNGRGSAICGDLVEETKEKWQSEYHDELAVAMLALVTLSAVQLLDLPFVMQYNWAQDENYEVMMVAPIAEDLDVGVTYRDDGKIMSFIRGTFDSITWGGTPPTRERIK
jgi:hypothetical protein